MKKVKVFFISFPTKDLIFMLSFSTEVFRLDHFYYISTLVTSYVKERMQSTNDNTFNVIVILNEKVRTNGKHSIPN